MRNYQYTNTCTYPTLQCSLTRSPSTTAFASAFRDEARLPSIPSRAHSLAKFLVSIRKMSLSVHRTMGLRKVFSSRLLVGSTSQTTVPLSISLRTMGSGGSRRPVLPCKWATGVSYFSSAADSRRHSSPPAYTSSSPSSPDLHVVQGGESEWSKDERVQRARRRIFGTHRGDGLRVSLGRLLLRIANLKVGTHGSFFFSFFLPTSTVWSQVPSPR